MNWIVSTLPTDLPVSLDTVRTHLRIGDAEGDDYLTLLVNAATQFAQEKMATSLMAQTITATFYAEDMLKSIVQTDRTAPYYAEYLRSVIALPRGPVGDIASVVDANNVAVEYERIKVGHSDRLRFPKGVTLPVTAEYSAGYASADDVPADIRMALLTHVGTLYENRESTISGTTIGTVPHSLEAFYELRARATGVR